MNSPKSSIRKLFTLLGFFSIWGIDCFRFMGSKNVETNLQPMFPYRVKCTESESDIQNINLLYKIDQQCHNTFELLDHFEKLQKNQCLFYYLYKLHNSYFVFFVFFCIFFVILVYIYIYINICIFFILVPNKGHPFEHGKAGRGIK